MFARLTFAKMQPGKFEEVNKIFAESIVPAAKAQKGFRGIYMLRSTEDPDTGIALAFWESKEDADTGVQSGYYQEQVQKVAPFFAAMPERKDYEVAVEG